MRTDTQQSQPNYEVVRVVVSRVTFASESPGPGGGQLPCGFAQEASYCLCGGLPASVAMERGRAKDL